MAKHDYHIEIVKGISSSMEECKRLVEDSSLSTENMPYSWDAGIFHNVVTWFEVFEINSIRTSFFNFFETSAEKFNSTIQSIQEIERTFSTSLVEPLRSLHEISVKISNLDASFSEYAEVDESYTWVDEKEAVIYKANDYVSYNPETDTYEYNWSRIATLFRGIKDVKKFEECLKSGKYYKLPLKDTENIASGLQSENLTENEYKQLCTILNSFVQKDGSIDAEHLQTFLELGCTDGNLMTTEGISDHQTDCGSVLRELSKYARKENAVISISLQSMDKSETKVPKSIMLVNNIVIATATAKPTPQEQGHYYDLHLAPKPIVIQQPYNPVDAVVNPSSSQPCIVGYEEPKSEPFKPQKRINIKLENKILKTSIDGKVIDIDGENVSVWSVGDFATVYEYSGNATRVLGDIKKKCPYSSASEIDEWLNSLKVDVPKSAFDLTDTGTFLDSAGVVLDIIDCVPVASEVISVLSLYNDGLVHEAFGLDSPEMEAAYEQHKQVEHTKDAILDIFNDFIKKLNDIESKSNKLTFSGAYFSAIYYDKNETLSLPDCNIAINELIPYVEQYNKKAITINSKSTGESPKLPILDEQKIISGDLSEFRQYFSTYMDTWLAFDPLDPIGY